MSLSPPNGHHLCSVKITAAQDELPSLSSSSSANSREIWINPSSLWKNSRRVICVPQFAIWVNLSVYVCLDSDASKRFEAVSLTREIRVPCSALTRTGAAEAKNIISSKLSYWRIHVPLDGASFMKKHYGDDLFSGCSEGSWVEQFQDFLRCMRTKSYNSDYNVLPLNLKIDKLVQISDAKYAKFVSWYAIVEQHDPNFLKCYKAVLRRASVQFYAANVDCPICLEDLDASRSLSLSCTHCFHGSCILKWLITNPSCPICRCRLRMD